MKTCGLRGIVESNEWKKGERVYYVEECWRDTRDDFSEEMTYLTLELAKDCAEKLLRTISSTERRKLISCKICSCEVEFDEDIPYLDYDSSKIEKEYITDGRNVQIFIENEDWQTIECECASIQGAREKIEELKKKAIESGEYDEEDVENLFKIVNGEGDSIE